MSQLIPAGIYSIPELSSVGLTEKQAHQQYGDIIVGTAKFAEVARGQISGNTEGMLKIVADAQGKKILGIMLAGEGSTEVVHIGHMAMLCGADIDIFVESTFNFPTLAEAYRIAALEILAKRPQ
jgi:NAD(P) transhydrogenase